jgi:hypothetical protein
VDGCEKKAKISKRITDARKILAYAHGRFIFGPVADTSTISKLTLNNNALENAGLIFFSPLLQRAQVIVILFC